MKEEKKNVKQKITEDWQNAFPRLVKYSQNKYYKILGPMIVGIELIKLPRLESYRPYFVCYPLWRENLKACFDAPIILKEFYDKKGIQFSIPYKKHNIFFSDVLNTIKKQMPLSLEGNVYLKNIILAIDEYSKVPPLNAAPTSYLQARLQESKLEIVLYSGNEEYIQRVLNQILKSNWDVNHFGVWKIDVNQWLDKMKDKINNRAKLLSHIKLNKQEKKLAKLVDSDIIVN